MTSESMLAAQTIDRLGELLGLAGDASRKLRVTSTGRWDLILETPQARFAVELKTRSNTEAISSALRFVDDAMNQEPVGTIPLVVVPFMGPVGRSMCEQQGINWFDLTGNALINGPGIRINISGVENRFSHRGRPRNVFSKKASRIARVMIANPARVWSNKKLAQETELSKGWVSRLLPRLTESGLIKEDSKGFSIADRRTLLSTWGATSDFDPGAIVKLHVTGRSPHEVLRRITDSLGADNHRVVATGLSAAWHYARHAGYRIASAYATPMPTARQLEKAGVREVEEGENLWLLPVTDDAILWDTTSEGGLEYVSMIQAFLDLQFHPERSNEAAEALLALLLENAGETA